MVVINVLVCEVIGQAKFLVWIHVMNPSACDWVFAYVHVEGRRESYVWIQVMNPSGCD